MAGALQNRPRRRLRHPHLHCALYLLIYLFILYLFLQPPFALERAAPIMHHVLKEDLYNLPSAAFDKHSLLSFFFFFPLMSIFKSELVSFDQCS